MRARSARVGAITLTVLLGGCTRWESYPVPRAPEPALPASLRVWSSGGVATELAQPFVRGDTLYGRSRGDTIGVSMARIERVARPRVDGLRTAGAVVGGLAGWIALGLAAGGWE
jgi:hypothetical protein